MTSLLFGLHDRDAFPLLPSGGWCVESVALSENPQPPNYQAIRSDINWNIRLNWAHNGKDGTIPAPSQYDDFAKRCADYVSAQKGAMHFSIANEPNHAQEWVNGVKIQPEEYAVCFNACYAAIKRARPDVFVAPAAVAPWNTQSGIDPIFYYKRMLAPIAACDELTVHGYTHGADPNLIWSDEMRSGWYWHFKIIYQTLDAVPGKFAMLPVHVTETDQGDDAWLDRNSGWVQNAYKSIDDYNRAGTSHPILSLTLYRWRGDKYELHNKPQLLDDFRAAVGKGYTSPVKGKEQMDTHIPVVSPGTPIAEPSLPPRNIDPRLVNRGVTVNEVTSSDPNQLLWKIVSAQFFNEQESGGRHHIYVEALDENGKPVNGVPFLVTGQGSRTEGNTNSRSGFDAANVPMWASEGKNGYTLKMWEGDSIIGLGMGDDTPSGFNAGIHTSILVEAQQKRAGVTVPQPPVVGDGPQPVPLPQPPVKPVEPVPSIPTGIIEPRVAQAILKVESGGRTHGEDGRIIIRFEAHIFKRYLGNDALFDQHFRYDQTRPWVNQQWRRVPSKDTWQLLHTGKQADEWAAFEFANSLNADASFMAISMGAAQIMGFNHARIGYSSAADMFTAFRDPLVQTIGFINFFLSDPALADAMRRKDWREIAKRYNGSGAVDTYAPLLEKAYKELGGS